ncbi:hypothetical protein DFH11DRAFT_1745759 [Phellopilus nigrolimitatus]|nr:hypothetical protein DFH11DRAFT_1745759 [Phellopilus nigrolimitatus]
MRQTSPTKVASFTSSYGVVGDRDSENGGNEHKEFDSKQEAEAGEKKKESIKRALDIAVYRVTLDNLIVIIKLYVGDGKIADFDKEVRNYERVHGLQGILFPCVLGIYKGRSSEGKGLGCLVLEDCGSPNNGALCRLPLSLKHHILEKIVIMHDHGFDKYGYDEDEFVLKDGECRFVSLGCLIEHACASPDRKWRKGNDWIDFSCQLLAEYASNLVAWEELRPRVQIGCNTYIATGDSYDLPGQAIIDKLTPVGFHATFENSDILKIYMLLAGKQGVTDEQSSIDSFKARTPLPDFHEKQAWDVEF